MSDVVLKTPKSSNSKPKLKVSSKLKTTSSPTGTGGDGEMELKSPFTSPTKKNKLMTVKRKMSVNGGNGSDDAAAAAVADTSLLESPKTPSTSKEKISLKSPKTPKTPKTPKSPSKRKSAKLLLEAPLSAPARAHHPNKSPSSKVKSKRRSSATSKDKQDRPSWWNLDDAALLFLQNDSDDEDNNNKQQQQKLLLTPEEIQRRNEQVQMFRDKYAKELQDSNGGVIKQGLVAKLLEQAHQQKERESKPIVLPNVRARPLKIDISKFEAPSYKKNVEQKTLLKETAKKNFILKDFVNTGAKTDIRKLVKAFESVEVENGKNIVEQGDQGDHYFVVESGEVEFQVDHVTVRTAGVGSTFGDRNLLYQAPWNQTIKAKEGASPIKLLRLHHNAYRGIMQTTEEAKKPAPPPPKFKTPSVVVEDENAWLVNSKAVNEMNAIKAALKKKTAADLERIKVLGEGQFGEVWLVAITDLPGVAVPKGKTQHEFALKIQNKLGGDEKMIANIRGEIKVMEELSHPFVSSMYTTYEDEDSIDMLLGLIPGGELWDVVHKENEETGEWLSGIPETHAQFYSMVVADTLNYMHSQEFIFRDLKMENIMIDAKGYPIIVDFGFAKKCPHKTFTFCGTPNYVAPEIIKNQGHGAPVDWWALGVVLYEMISGENPFYYDGLEQMDLYQAICDDKPEPLKEGFSKSMVDLIDKLLIKDPTKRLGSGKKKGKEVLNHVFYTGLNLKRLRLKKIKAPWIPGQDEEANRKEYEAELEKERQVALEEEARVQADSKRQAEQEEAIRQAEEEARVYAEQQELKRQQQQQEAKKREQEEEEEERKRLEVEEQERRAEEAERKRQEKEAAAERKHQEELRLQRLQEEEERQRLEEEEAAERQRQEELRQQRLQEEEEKERRRQEEEEKERVRLEKEAEEERERLRIQEEAERQRQEEEELRLEKDAEEERLRLKEEEKQRRKEERERLRLEKERQLQLENEEKERKRLQKEEEEAEKKRKRLEKKRKEKEELRLQKKREEEEQKRLETEEKEKEKTRRLKEERLKQKELEKQRGIELEMELDRQRQEAQQEAFTEEEGELSLDDVFQPQRIANLEGNWNEAAMSPTKKGYRRNVSDLSPVPDGLVKKVVTGGLEGTSPKNLYSPRVQEELNRSIGKGLVAKRLSMAKAKEKMGGSVPSMFSNFNL